MQTTSSSTRTANNANNTTNINTINATTIVNPAVQTSVIQSTKAYKNGNSNTAASAAAAGAALIIHTGSAVAQAATTTTASTTQTTIMSTTTMADDDVEDDDNNGGGVNLNNEDDDDATVADADDRCEAADHNNGSLSSSSSMSNSDPCKQQQQQADQLKQRNRRNSAACGGVGVVGVGCGPLIGDYACGGDVEMENNGHIANGNNHKNGSSFETSEDMGKRQDRFTYLLYPDLNIFLRALFVSKTDVDLVLPAKKSIKSGVERMLEFGRELFQLSQRLEIEQGPNETHQKMLEV